MIIKQVTIRNWRALANFETELSPGLNVLRGQNEAGKSTIVEAISWALHRDVVGGARVKDEIAPIIPATDPKAKPCVELLLEFPDCTASIRKTLAEESAQRECCLTIRRPGKADQNFDQSAAQNELRRLMAADGAPHSASTSSVDVSLLVSPQGQSTQFVGQELSSSARSSIVVGESGAIAPTSRLEKVRVALEKKRSKELFEKLKANAVDAAKKQTDAARLRDELAALRDEHAKYSQSEAQIASLRAQIANIIEEYKVVAPRAERSHKELVELRARYEMQIVVAGEVAEKRRAHDEAKAQRGRLQQQIEEIAKLRGESTRLAVEAQRLQEELAMVREYSAEWKEKVEAAWRAKEEAENNWQQARERLQAWDGYLQVCAANRERKRWREQVEQLEKLHAAVELRRKELEELGRAPNRLQIRRWSEQFNAIEQARHTASQTLKISLHLEWDGAIVFQADDADAQDIAVAAGEEITLGAGASAELSIDGVGKIAIAGSGKEAKQQSIELKMKIRSIEKDLAPFDVRLSQLPAAFESLEERAATYEAASQQLQFAEQQLSTHGGASLEEAREQLEIAEAEYSRARESCEPLRAHIPEGVKSSQANIERERAREKENEIQQQADAARRAWHATQAKLLEYSNAETKLDTQLKSYDEQRTKIATRLHELENDGFRDDERAHQLDELNEKFWRAKNERDELIERLEASGAIVTSEVVARVEIEAKELRETQIRLEKERAEKHAELRGYCEQDPQTELDRLSYEIEIREEEIVRRESQLRGVAILEAALEAERHRLGRAIAAPLNEFLSPWLSELRDKKTRVEFDEDTGRITGVMTEHNGSTHVLPFASHSGGMQEQTALALRLILAQAAAKKLQSGRLPLILDDPLTQTDSSRRGGLWRVLREASSHLQILFVTCHEEQLPRHVDVNWITIGEWRDENVETTPVQPAVVSETPRRTKSKVKSQTNGHNSSAEEVTSGTLSLW